MGNACLEKSYEVLADVERYRNEAIEQEEVVEELHDEVRNKVIIRLQDLFRAKQTDNKRQGHVREVLWLDVQQFYSPNALKFQESSSTTCSTITKMSHFAILNQLFPKIPHDCFTLPNVSARSSRTCVIHSIGRSFRARQFILAVYRSSRRMCHLFC